MCASHAGSGQFRVRPVSAEQFDQPLTSARHGGSLFGNGYDVDPVAAGFSLGEVQGCRAFELSLSNTRRELCCSPLEVEGCRSEILFCHDTQINSVGEADINLR